MAYQYRTKGVCSRNIHFDIQNGLVTDVHFDGGCNGNTQGVSRLVEGMPVEEAIRRMEGIQCGFKGTSCPDQLAKALKAALQEAENTAESEEQ
ncbi:MAG: TIGR03905 family TSCPD domain-containing protein [Clostridia bacterium]|nr:TIGR03905 family TSCPD domain-containing protein [Clostridia bacterium]